MKNKPLIISTVCLTAALAALVYYGFSGPDGTATRQPSADKLPPGQRLQAGPYGEGVSLAETVGVHTLQLTAASLYLEKTKTLGFSNALVKKMVARDLTLTVLYQGDKRLEVYKDQESMRPGMNEIVVKDPVVRFPPEIEPPASVAIDKKKKQLIIRYPDATTTWDLTRKPT